MRRWLIVYIKDVPIPILFAALDKLDAALASEQLEAFMLKNALNINELSVIAFNAKAASLPWPMAVRGADQTLNYYVDYNEFLEGPGFEVI